MNVIWCFKGRKQVKDCLLDWKCAVLMMIYTHVLLSVYQTIATDAWTAGAQCCHHVMYACTQVTRIMGKQLIMCMRAHTHTHACTHACAHAHTHIHTHTWIHFMFMNVYVHALTCMHDEPFLLTNVEQSIQSCTRMFLQIASVFLFFPNAISIYSATGKK